MNETPPEEFRHGWPVVAGTFLILTMGFGSAYSFGTFFAPAGGRVRRLSRRRIRCLLRCHPGPFQRGTIQRHGRRPPGASGAGIRWVGSCRLRPHSCQRVTSLMASSGRLRHLYRRRSRAGLRPRRRSSPEMVRPPPRTRLRHRRFRHRGRHPRRSALRRPDDSRTGLETSPASGRRNSSRCWRSIRPDGHQSETTVWILHSANTKAGRRFSFFRHSLTALLPAVPRLPLRLLRTVHPHCPHRSLCRRPRHLAADGGGPAQPSWRRQCRWPLYHRRSGRPHRTAGEVSACLSVA